MCSWSFNYDCIRDFVKYIKLEKLYIMCSNSDKVEQKQLDSRIVADNLIVVDTNTFSKEK